MKKTISLLIILAFFNIGCSTHIVMNNADKLPLNKKSFISTDKNYVLAISEIDGESFSSTILMETAEVTPGKHIIEVMLKWWVDYYKGRLSLITEAGKNYTIKVSQSKDVQGKMNFTTWIEESDTKKVVSNIIEH